LPSEIAFEKAYPNPFTSVTNISYTLPYARPIRIQVVDILGRSISTLQRADIKAAGYHTVQFNADGLASGTYLIRMEAGNFVATQQVVLLK